MFVPQVDATSIYGKDVKTELMLRSLSHGKLKMQVRLSGMSEFDPDWVRVLPNRDKSGTFLESFSIT